MNTIRLPIILAIFSILISLASNTAYADRRQWNNPESEQRYKKALRQQSAAYRNETRAWNNYVREIERAQQDVRAVRNGAANGALKGGVPGAAWGGTKSAVKRIFYRARDAYKSRRYR